MNENCIESSGSDLLEDVNPTETKKNKNSKSKRNQKKKSVETPTINGLINLTDVTSSKKQKKKTEREEKYIEENEDSLKLKQKQKKLKKRMDTKMNNMAKKLEENGISEKEISFISSFKY